jgi:adenylate cyclase
MATEGFKRKLAAVFSADVAGYSRLMGEDEAATLTILEAYKQVLFVLVKQHRGRVVASPGDNVLAEFASVVDAVQCGVAVQKEIETRNTELPESRRMQFRIGINLGDVIEEGDSIYGDGVNIAARLESLADPGGICVSKTAFEHIEAKLPFGYEFLGEQTVKNIAKPVGTYRVLMDPRVTVKAATEIKPKVGSRRKPMLVALFSVLVLMVGAAVFWYFTRPPTPPPVEKASKDRMALPLPDKPSIAVMPFVNMTGDQTQDFFCDGLTESLITALSKVPQLLVIARESTFRYKGKGAKISQVSEELGVQYILEGSVQKAGDRVRVTAQLIDALKGHHLWSERYDRSMKDLFDLQDEITMKILTELQVMITEDGRARIHAKGTNNLQAYLKVLEGNGYLNQGTKEAQAEAERLYQEAMELDPNYPMAYVGLAYALYIDVLMGASESPKEMLSNAMRSAQKTVELDNSSAEAHAVVCNIFVGMREYDKAIEAGERAVTVGPNNSMALGSLANCLIYTGRSEEALPLLRQAIRLDPFRSGPYRLFAHACRETGRYEEGIAALKKFLQIAPNDVTVRLILVSLYMYAGREDEARATVTEIQRIAPNFSLERFAKASPWKDEATRDRLIDSLRRAGLK